jgi:hypothetical protein
VSDGQAEVSQEKTRDSEMIGSATLAVAALQEEGQTGGDRRAADRQLADNGEKK